MTAREVTLGPRGCRPVSGSNFSDNRTTAGSSLLVEGSLIAGLEVPAVGWGVG